MFIGLIYNVYRATWCIEGVCAAAASCGQHHSYEKEQVNKTSAGISWPEFPRLLESQTISTCTFSKHPPEPSCYKARQAQRSLVVGAGRALGCSRVFICCRPITAAQMCQPRPGRSR